MEDGCREHGVGMAEGQDVVEVLELAGAARGDDRHIDGVGNGARQLDVIAVLRAVGIHARQKDLASAERDGLPDPLEAVEARRRAAAVDVDLPLVVARAARVDGEHHALAAELLRAFLEEARILDGCRVERCLVGTGLEHAAHVLDRADAAADRERDEDLRGAVARDIDHRAAVVARGRDIEEDELIRSLLVVTGSELDGIARVAQSDKVRALDDTPVLDVKTRDNAFRIHLF